MAMDYALRNTPVPSQPSLEGQDLVVVGALHFLFQWRHLPAFHEEIHEPPDPVHVFGGQASGTSATRATASMPRETAHDAFIDLIDRDLAALQPVSEVPS
ncbi:hypothetical protein AB9K35_18405 [Leisingera sp. XS_AS12]